VDEPGAGVLELNKGTTPQGLALALRVDLGFDGRSA
jgi:hypothetical protein